MSRGDRRVTSHRDHRGHRGHALSTSVASVVSVASSFLVALFFSLSVSLVSPGCGGEDIGTYAKGSIQARDDAMIVRAETEAASKLGQYQARYGTSPASLEQLEAAMGALAPIPPGWRYAYDPANPKVRVVPEGAP